jgi:glycosyltransferase involved in cell wall biosynthesis
MRVLHIHGGNLFGGVETMLLTIARLGHLSPTMQSSFAVCFDQRFAAALRDAGIAPFVIGGAQIRNFRSVARAQARLFQIMSQVRFHAVICHMPWAQALFGSVVRRANVPLLLWMHGVGSQYHPLDRWARLTPPDHIICNSQYVALSARRLYPRTECSVCYPPVALRGARLTGDLKVALRRELDTPADAIVVVQASRIEPWKGHDVLLQSLAVLRGVPKWICWIAGDAQNPAEVRWLRKLRTIALRLGIIQRIRFLGHRSDISTLFQAADVYCQANSSPEPFGIAFVEALEAGIPVVATAFNDTHEVVDLTCGLLVPSKQPEALAEALLRLFENDLERRRLGDGGLTRARLLCDPDSQLRRLCTIVKSAVSPASPESQEQNLRVL